MNEQLDRMRDDFHKKEKKDAFIRGIFIGMIIAFVSIFIMALVIRGT